MSTILEKVRDVDHLPIFPLPLVLMPNELLPLHIFEPRYREMLEDIGGKGGLFGLSFFSNEDGFEDKPALNSIGCIAEIRDMQEVEDGRSNILTIGLIRYEIYGYVDLETPYLTASVSIINDDAGYPEHLDQVADEAYELFSRVAKAAFKLSGNRDQMPEIDRSDPEALSFLIAAAFNLSNNTKYELLQLTSTIERLERLLVILRQAAEQMEDSAEIGHLSKTNGHSKKKLDL